MLDIEKLEVPMLVFVLGDKSILQRVEMWVILTGGKKKRSWHQ